MRLERSQKAVQGGKAFKRLEMDAKAELEIWAGRVPLALDLATEDVTTFTQPPTLYLMLPRMSYLPLHTPEIRKHFAGSAVELQDELWFECGDTILHWHVPIGVLFDLYLDQQKTSLPWTITVHFNRFPSDQLMRCRNLETVRSHFLNTLKEACFLRFNATRPATSLSKEDHTKLWKAVLNAQHGEFEEVKESILDAAQEPFVCLPVRFYVRGLHEDVDERCVQLPVTLTQPESEDVHTLRSAVQHTLQLDDGTYEQCRILVQGIQPPDETPMDWLCEHFCNPDMFLYVVVWVDGKR